jgi:hypothetical protein
MRFLMILGVTIMSFLSLAQEELTKEAPVDVYVFDVNKERRVGDRITLFNEAYRFSGVSDSTGKFRITLQGGETYMVIIHGFGFEEEYSTFTVPNLRDGVVYPVSMLKITYEKPMSAISCEVMFDTGSAELTDEELKAIRNIGDYMKRNPNAVLTVKGYTDNVGTEIANMALSVNRTGAVVAALERLGVSRNRLKIQSYGETQPKSSNATVLGRSQNRRVEVSVTE